MKFLMLATLLSGCFDNSIRREASIRYHVLHNYTPIERTALKKECLKKILRKSLCEVYNEPEQTNIDSNNNSN